ncbi:MAG TPA: hypothetical protein VHE54_00970, partial [Puia sp.]|nr:hypothetical protein [Puia sp.]
MLLNFLKVAWRNLFRGKAFSLINITGLAAGMAAALLILLWVQNELSFDRDYANSDRLYQTWNRETTLQGVQCSNVTPKVIGPTLRKEFPEIERASRIGWDESLLFTVGDKKID